MDTLIYIFESGDFWAILLKVLITALLTGAVSLLCTLMGKIIVRMKNSKLKEHAKIAVEAAEQKFPNEGTKMGPQKMAYVMDYLAVTFPKIKSNQYLYNIAEATVYELNKEKEAEVAKKEFEEKYGEIPVADTTKTVVDKAANKMDDVVESIPSDITINSLATTTVESKKETKKIMNIF